jgi:pyrroline-5-carboxylate reductase
MKIAFLGAGKMAGALIRGFLGAGLVRPEEISSADVNAEALKALADETGIHAAPSNATAVEGAEIVFLCVKPQAAARALAEAALDGGQSLLVSIAAGVRVDALRRMTACKRVIRVMPNTAAMAGMSATAIVADLPATESDIHLIQKFFEAVGTVFRVSEDQMDAVTALSGSGPAFCYLVLEAMADGAVACGLPRDLARELAGRTMAGAAKMAEGEHPAVLREMVTSPGGTTIAGLLELEQTATRSAFAEAVRAAAARSAEMSAE